MKKKLLFITPELPYPPQSGGKVKSLKLLDSLAERYEVTLVSPLKLDDHLHRRDFEERSSCHQHIHRRVAVPRSFGSLLASYGSRRPLNVQRSYQGALADQVRRLAPSHDVIFLDHYEGSVYLPKNYRGTVVYHAHNSYHQIWQRYAGLPGNPAFRAAAWVESRRVRSAELQVARRSDLVFAAPNDAGILAANGIDPGKIAHTFHLGDDAQLQLPDLQHSDTQLKLMYVGFLGWEANVQGLLWFISEVWPLLLQSLPGLRFAIVGKNPDGRLRDAVAKHPGINLLGFVDDLQPIYREARVSVAPLLFGSGMKVKVLDAMARGIPTVTTAVGAEGIDYIDGQHLAVTSGAADMAAATLKLLQDEALWTRMRDASRALIRARYTWRQLLTSMHGRLEETIAGRQETRNCIAQPPEMLQHA